MANGETSASEAELKANVDLIERNLADLKSATSTSVWVGRLVLLVIAVVMLLQILSIYRVFQNIDKDAYVKAAQSELDSLLPKVLEQAGTLAENLAPVYQEALLKEFDASMPKIAETFSKELDLFVAHVGENIQTSLDQRFKKVLDKQLDILAREMPELKDDAKRKEIMENVLDCAYTAGQKLSGDLFKPQIDALADLSATIETVEIPQDLQKMNDSNLLYFATNKIGELFLLKMVIFEDVFVESVKKDITGK
jgi:fumarate reductase subunit D